MTKPTRVPEVLPPPESYQHGEVVHEDVDVRNPGPKRARRKHPLEYLETIGSLTSRQASDGMRFHTDWQRAMAGASASQYDGVPVPESYYGRTPTEAVLNVVSRVNRIFAVMDWHEALVCRRVIGEATGLTVFARAVATHTDRAKAALLTACDKLGQVYDQIDAEARGKGRSTR